MSEYGGFEGFGGSIDFTYPDDFTSPSRKKAKQRGITQGVLDVDGKVIPGQEGKQ